MLGLMLGLKDAENAQKPFKQGLFLKTMLGLAKKLSNLYILRLYKSLAQKSIGILATFRFILYFCTLNN